MIQTQMWTSRLAAVGIEGMVGAYLVAVGLEVVAVATPEVRTYRVHLPCTR